MEIVKTVSAEWGSNRVRVRLSPLGTFSDIGDEHPEVTFGHRFLANPDLPERFRQHR